MPVAGSLLAIALAMALSSVPIMATIVILLSPRRRGPSLAFLAGWVLTIAVVPLAAASGTLAMPCPGESVSSSLRPRRSSWALP